MRDYTLTEQSQLLCRLYSERDLVLAQAITEGVLDDLSVPQIGIALAVAV